VMRRRGLEPPPGYPGPGPQDGGRLTGEWCFVQQRRFCRRWRILWTPWTGWMLSKVLSR